MQTFNEIKTTFLSILKKPEMQILPGQIAFYFLMSIIPIAAITTAVASYITKDFNFVQTLSSVVPKAFSDILISLSSNMEVSGVFLVIILYVLLASNAPSSIIIASNMLYGVKQPRFINLKVKSFVMTIMIVLLLLFVILIPLFGDLIVKILVDVFNTNLYSYRFVYKIVKIVFSCLIVFSIIKLLFTMAPSAKIKSKMTTKGAIFTTVSWMLVTELYAFYITHIASYDVVYGTFANILILLMWLYLLGYLFVVGMAINVEVFVKQGKCTYEKKKEGNENKKRKQKK